MSTRLTACGLFTLRLLLANEDAVFGLHDVWLAAATSQDRDDEFSQVDDDGPQIDDSVFGDDESQLDDDGFGYDDGASEFGSIDDRGRMYFQNHPRTDSRLQSQSSAKRRESMVRQRLGSRVSPRPSFSGTNQPPNSYNPLRFASGMRTTSISSSAVRPAIYNNTGLSTPPSHGPSPFMNAYNAQQQAQRERISTPGTDGASVSTGQTPTGNNNLAVIPEGAQGRVANAVVPESSSKPEHVEQNSVFSQLPLAIIGQYAIVALHGTTCDQLFM